MLCEYAAFAGGYLVSLLMTFMLLCLCVQAIFRSRKIFQRMRNYCLYRISCTIQLLFFFFFALVAMEPNSANFYGTQYPFNDPSSLTDDQLPYGYSRSDLENAWNGGPSSWTGCQIDHNVAFTLPVLSLVVITILNDGTIITIAYDKVIPDNRPQSWDMVEVTIVSFLLAIVACLSSLTLLVLCMQSRGDDWLALVRKAWCCWIAPIVGVFRSLFSYLMVTFFLFWFFG